MVEKRAHTWARNLTFAPPSVLPFHTPSFSSRMTLDSLLTDSVSKLLAGGAKAGSEHERSLFADGILATATSVTGRNALRKGIIEAAESGVDFKSFAHAISANCPKSEQADLVFGAAMDCLADADTHLAKTAATFARPMVGKLSDNAMREAVRICIRLMGSANPASCEAASEILLEVCRQPRINTQRVIAMALDSGTAAASAFAEKAARLPPKIIDVSTGIQAA